jgi:hypothetical protein
MLMSGWEDQVQWVHAWPNSEQPEFRVGRIGQDLVAEWPGFASLRSDRAGTRSEHRFNDPSVDPMIAAKFQRGQVAALLRHLRGELSLHAAAAEIAGRSVVLLGESNAGKSSTIAGLSKYRAARFLADDIAALIVDDGIFQVRPTETHHWLAPDSIDTLGLETPSQDWDKHPIMPVMTAAHPAEIAVIVKLGVDAGAPAPQLSRLHGGAVFELLSSSAIRFVLDEERTALRDFQTMAELAAQAPVFELRRPPGIEWLRPCVNVIGDLLETHREKGASS